MYMYVDLEEIVLKDIADNTQAAIDDGKICNMEQLEDFILYHLDRFNLDISDPRNIETIIDLLDDLSF